MTAHNRRGALLLLASTAALVLSGCSTFRPVYGPGSEMGLAFVIDEPKTPLERIAWREFLLRFEGTHRTDSPRLSYNVSVGGVQRQLTSPKRKPPETAIVRSTITATITYEGKTLLQVTRFADATLTLGRGSVPDMVSREEAEERATKAAAESIRIAILAEFPRHEAEWSRASR